MFWILGLLAAQPLPVALEPSGPWTVTREGVGCRVVRSYGTEPAIQIGFETVLTGQSRTLLVVGPKTLLPDGIGETPVTLDAGAAVRLHYGSFAVADSKLRLLKLFGDDAALQQLADTKSIGIGPQALSLRMEGTRAAFAALDKCTVDLLVSWGADPQLYLQKKMAGLTGSPAQWFTSASYPKEARSKGASGLVVLLLNAERDGGVGRCTVVASADESLNAGTCAIATRHLRLKPPVDATGQPMASYAVLPIRWVAP